MRALPAAQRKLSVHRAVRAGSAEATAAGMAGGKIKAFHIYSEAIN